MKDIDDLSSDFNRFWLGTGLSAAGGGIQRAAVPLIAATITRDPIVVGTIVASSRLPWLLLSIPIGRWIDSRSPFQVIRASATLRAIAATLLAIFLLNSWTSIYVLSALVFVVATGDVMGDTAWQTWIAHSQKPSAFPKANARLYGTNVVLGHMAGPAVAGLLIGFAVYVPTGLCAILQILATAAFWWAAFERPQPDKLKAESVLSEHRKGALAFILNRRSLVGLVLIGVISMLVYGMWITAIVLFATDPHALDLTPAKYGFLMLSMPVGSLLGTTVMPRLLRITNGYWCVVASCVGVSILPVGGAISKNEYFVAATMFVYGLLLSAWNISAVSFRQQIIPKYLLGRVTSLYRLASWGAMPIGSAIGGLLCEYTDVRTVFIACLLISVIQYPLLLLISEMKSYRG